MRAFAETTHFPPPPRTQEFDFDRVGEDTNASPKDLKLSVDESLASSRRDSVTVPLIQHEHPFAVPPPVVTSPTDSCSVYVCMHALRA